LYIAFYSQKGGLMALSTAVYTGASGGRETPPYGEFVENGYTIAAALGLSMAPSGLSVHPDVLAGRLGYLRLLIDAWKPERRAQALRQEHAQVCVPSEDKSKDKPSPSDQPDQPDPDSPPEEPTQSRWRRGGRDRRVNARVQSETDDYLVRKARERGVSKSDLVDHVLVEWKALQESLAAHPPRRERETDV
jgi:hypothetical protein